jgi:DNA repair exonuclease SbcCD ATPase subunit
MSESNELKAACEVLAYAFVNFPALDGQVEKQLCATLIAEHTRHEGKTAQQWADECRSYQRNLADAQADIAGEVEHSKELATRVTELEALASRLKEQRDTPTKPCWWLSSFGEAQKEAARLAKLTGKKIHVLKLAGTMHPPGGCKWEER